jgi:hypothetical protein
MNMLGLLSSVRIAHIASYWKFFLSRSIQILCQSRLRKADRACFTYIMLQRQLSHLNGRKLDHHQVQPFIFSMSGFALSYTANMFILMIQSHCDWQLVSLSVLVSSPVWDLWPDINYCSTVTVLPFGGRPLWREDGSVIRQSVSSIRSIVSMYNFYILRVSHVIEYIYNIYKASVSPGSVQQIMPYFW